MSTAPSETDDRYARAGNPARRKHCGDRNLASAPKTGKIPGETISYEIKSECMRKPDHPRLDPRCVIAALLTVSCGLTAQSLFEKSPKQLPYAAPAKGLLVEDLNGDGASDLLFYGGYGSSLRPDRPVPPRFAPHLWLNNGVGWLQDLQDRKILATEFVTSGRLLVDAAARDLDDDGDLDLVLLYRDAPILIPPTNVLKVLINDGRGDFTDATSSWLADL